MSRTGRFLVGAAVLLLLPAAARAEVSVVLDGHGRVRRVVVVSRSADSIWGQVRARVPLETMLNPLGDTRGDLAPSIAIHPKTGQPWAVWPRNEGNQKRLVVSYWTSSGWTNPQPLVTPDLVGSDQIEPRLVFDIAGTPFLVFTEAARPSRIRFVTMARGVWTPALSLSDEKIDSRRPLASLSGDGTGLNVRWSTPTGEMARLLPTAVLVESATNLMDSPLPPGATGAPGTNEGSGAEEPGDRQVFPH
ncbi:MAG TPA: hypothetical protein VJV75_11405 [Candidatus Polarisedimenticolia bacterium]|nr:hypothetical protein [Candidatus Polarisedimenticolia bacterium]